MSLESIIYLAPSVGALGIALRIAFAILTALFVILSFPYFLDNEFHVECKKVHFKPHKWAIASAITLMLSFFIPSKQTIYLLGSTHIASEMYQNSEQLQQLPEKSVEALNKWLDCYISEVSSKSEEEE